MLSDIISLFIRVVSCCAKKLTMKIEVSLIIFVLGSLVTLTSATSNKIDNAYEGGSFLFALLKFIVRNRL